MLIFDFIWSFMTIFFFFLFSFGHIAASAAVVPISARAHTHKHTNRITKPSTEFQDIVETQHTLMQQLITCIKFFWIPKGDVTNMFYSADSEFESKRKLMHASPFLQIKKNLYTVVMLAKTGCKRVLNEAYRQIWSLPSIAQHIGGGILYSFGCHYCLIIFHFPLSYSCN